MMRLEGSRKEDWPFFPATQHLRKMQRLSLCRLVKIEFTMLHNELLKTINLQWRRFFFLFFDQRKMAISISNSLSCAFPPRFFRSRRHDFDGAVCLEAQISPRKDSGCGTIWQRDFIISSWVVAMHVFAPHSENGAFRRCSRTLDIDDAAVRVCLAEHDACLLSSSGGAFHGL